MSSSTPVFDKELALNLIEKQVSLGPRAPGLKGHSDFLSLLISRIEGLGLEAKRQDWSIIVNNKPMMLSNVFATIEGNNPENHLLIGTHYDTRLIADRETNPELINKPILGANDGGSGTAIQIELAKILKANKPPLSITLVWFDGEDLGGIDNLEYAVGSRYFVSNLPCEKPDKVIILDMVGGMDMHLNIDGNSLRTLGSREILTSLFNIGRGFGLKPWFNNNPTWIVCDHIPFIGIDIPSVLLIDINYPQWHTQSDIPCFCSSESLYAIGQVLIEYIYKGRD